MKLHEGKFIYIYIYIRGPEAFVRWRYYRGPIILARSSLYRDILPTPPPKRNSTCYAIHIYIYACNDTWEEKRGAIKKLSIFRIELEER